MTSSSAPVSLRPALPADHDAIAGLEGLSGATRRLLARDLAGTAPRTALVARAGGRVVAFGMTTAAPDEVHLLDLVVAPAARRRGLGRRLVAALAARARDDGAAAMTLEVRVGNEPARRLYAALGFASAGIRPGYYRDGEDADILWHRDLASLAAAAAAPATTATRTWSA